MCLRRFIARRGKPTVIYSDNGTNFVAANRELRKCIHDWNQDMIGGVLSQEGIQCVFNPPAAPHMRGVWGRLVRSCKKALDVVLRNQVLTDKMATAHRCGTDLVLVSDYTVPRGNWPLGRIVKVFPGHDNVVRSAEVKFGVMKRPVTKLALLEECSPN